MKYLIILLKGVRQLLTRAKIIKEFTQILILINALINAFIIGFVTTCIAISLIALIQIGILNTVPHSIIFGFCIMWIIFAPLILFLKY